VLIALTRRFPLQTSSSVGSLLVLSARQNDDGVDTPADDLA
jgi:hypothetical protein